MANGPDENTKHGYEIDGRHVPGGHTRRLEIAKKGKRRPIKSRENDEHACQKVTGPAGEQVTAVGSLSSAVKTAP